MAEMHNPRLSGHEYVTGRATFRPDPGGRESSSEGMISEATGRVQEAASAVGTAAESAWDSMVSCMRSYPLAVFATGIGLGVFLALTMAPSRQTDWRS